MKSFISKEAISTLASVLFFLAIVSLIAIKVNYFTDLNYKTSSKVELNVAAFEHKPDWPWAFAGKPNNINPELHNLLTRTVSENGWNIEFYTPHPAGNKMIVSEIPFHIDYFIKSPRFVKQELEIKMNDCNSFTIAYHYGGIKRIRSIKAGQQLNEIELNLSIACQKNINPVILNDYLNRTVIACIYSPPSFAEKLLKHHLTVQGKQDASVITVNYPDAHKAKQIADALAHQLAEHEFTRKNKLIDEAIEKVLSSEMQRFGYNRASASLPEKTEESVIASLYNKQNELILQLKALDNLHEYLRQNRIEGNAVPAFGTLNDPVFAQYITSLNQKIQQLKEATDTEEQTRLHREIEFLKNTLAEGMRNTRKTVALQIDETSRMLSQLHHQPVEGSALPEQSAYELEPLLAQKKLNLLLDKKANASEMAMVSEAPLPLTPENPDKAAVWFIALITGLICSMLFNRLFRKKKTISVQVQQEESHEKLFTTLPAGETLRSKQIRKWAEEIFALHTHENKPCIITLTHAENNSSSFTAFELAAAAVSSGARTLVMDANLSKSQLESITGMEIPVSFPEMLTEGRPFDECITALPTGLKMVCIDTKSHEFHPVFLINKMQEMIHELPDLDLIIIAAPASQETLTLQLIRICQSAFVIHTAGRFNKKIAHRWKNIFRIEHVFDVISNNTSPIPQQFKSKNKIRSIRSRINNEPEKMNWFRRAALWFY